MKNLLFIACISCVLATFTSTAVAQKSSNSTQRHQVNTKSLSTKFIEDIEIKADNVSYVQPVSTEEAVSAGTTPKDNSAGIESMNSLQFKYAQLLDCNVEDVKNLQLYKFIDEWWETRYRYGGNTKKGVDCSAFTGLLMGTVYAVKLPRTARDQYSQCEKIDKEEMEEGDLVFFNTRGGVSHVGVYLGDGHFVHASTNSGVTISRLDEPYYESRFIHAGRVTGQGNMASQ